MCERVTGKNYTIRSFQVAYKVVDGDGRNIYYYHGASYREAEIPIQAGKIRNAIPHCQKHPYQDDEYHTVSGIHVFFSKFIAEGWAKSAQADVDNEKTQIAKVLVWGNAIPFEDGAAVEFMTFLEFEE